VPHTTPKTGPLHPGAGASAGGVRLRAYRTGDRAAVRRICADTGFLGQPIDPLFEDRELFADYLTDYYTRFEADALLVCEVSGEVRGYLMGCRRPLLKQAYQFFANIAVAVKALWRCYALTDARSVRNTRALIHSFLDFLRAQGYRRVYGQMITYSTRRTEGLFNRYGFELIDRVRVTKYRALHSGPVMLATVVKELRPRTLGGGDRL